MPALVSATYLDLSGEHRAAGDEVQIPDGGRATVLRPLLERACLIAQLPLDRTEPRPAQVLIASRSDVADMPAAELWSLRHAMVGDVLRYLAITDGPNGVELVGPDGACHFPGEPIHDLADSIGAGDFFAAGLIGGLARGFSTLDATASAQSVARTFLLDRPAILAEPIDLRPSSVVPCRNGGTGFPPPTRR